MPFYQYPLQVEKLETIILCEARTAGVIVYYPLSALIAVGVSLEGKFLWGGCHVAISP